MATITKVLSVNWGETGKSLAFHVVDSADANLIARTSTGVVEFPTGSGLYRVTIATWDSSWSGRVIWDDGAGNFAADSFEPAAAGGGTGNVTIAPLQSSVESQLVVTTNVPPITQASAPSLIWAIADASGNAVDLSGKTVRFVAAERNTETSPAIISHDSGANLSVGGTSHNQVTVQLTADDTSVAQNLHYWLWNITDSIPLARGLLPIAPAKKSAT